MRFFSRGEVQTSRSSKSTSSNSTTSFSKERCSSASLEPTSRILLPFGRCGFLHDTLSRSSSTKIFLAIALASASSSLVWQSLTWHSRSLRSLSNPAATSCSARSSSARRAASVIAFTAFPSEILASPTISSKST